MQNTEAAVMAEARLGLGDLQAAIELAELARLRSDEAARERHVAEAEPGFDALGAIGHAREVARQRRGGARLGTG